VTKRPALIPLAIVAGIALLALAALYFVDSADALPAFIPGHQAGSAHHHVKHGIATLLLGIGCFVFAWFQTEPATRARTDAPRAP
jgi:hypothetical protein